MNLSKFVKERDEALLSLDREKIEKYSKKYGVQLPSSETAFWACVHKAIIAINSATADQKKRSHDWLIEHGFKPWIS